MLAWANEPSTSVKIGKPYLAESDGILALHFDTRSVQSSMRIEMPDELMLDYTRAMMVFLLLEPTPARIAMIGLGGGSLAKYCYRYLPRAELTVIEINPDVIALRNEFAMPPDDARFRVIQGDGAEWVTGAANQPDVLIVDGFDADGLPAQLSSQQFYDDCFAALAGKGVMVANLWAGYPRYNEYVQRIRNSFAGRILVTDADDGVNRIVVALKNEEFPPASFRIRQHADLLGLSHPLDFQSKANKLILALPDFD